MTMVTRDPCVYRVVETRAAGEDNMMYYVPHFTFPDEDPPRNQWYWSTYDEVKG